MMVRALWLVPALALAPACDLVLGLTIAPPVDAPDAPPPVTKVRISRDELGLRNDAAGAPVVGTPTPIDIPDVYVELANGRRASVQFEDDLSATFDLEEPDQAFRVRVREPVDTEYQLAAAALKLRRLSLGRLDRRPPGPSTTLRVVNIAPPAGGDLYLTTTGVWSFTNAPDSSSFLFNASELGWFVPPPGLLSAAALDRAYVTAFTTVTEDGQTYAAITNVCQLSAFEMATNIESTAMCSLQPVGRGGCVRVDQPLAEIQRLQSAVAEASAWPVTGVSWVLIAPPAPTLTTTLGHRLAIRGSSPATPATGNVQFHNPYPGHVPRMVFNATILRRFLLPPATTPLDLPISTTHLVTPAPDCTTTTSAPSTVAITGEISLDGQLVTDNAVIAIPTDRRVPMTWSVPVPGGVDYYIAQVYEVTVQGVATVPLLQRQYVVTDTGAELPADVFRPGRHYALAVIAVDALVAGAAPGDYTTFDPATYSTSTVWSGVFRTP